ncbi:MAG: F0F1 ATP synthase subunit gamma [Holosporales bacterium]|nr:F0F1 ATP synthase subunit gamma [Holosporales bacterium]
MENLREIKDRIKTIGNLVKATNAIKMVSTIKLSKLNSLKKSSKKCSDVLLKLLKKVIIELKYKQLLESKHWLNRTAGETLIVVLSSDQGFCGSFNQMIAEKAKEMIKVSKGAFVEIYGKKAAILMRNSKSGSTNVNKVEKNYEHTYLVHALADTIIQYLVKRDVCEVYIISGEFKNVLVQKAKCTKLFPINIDATDTSEYTLIDGDKKDIVVDLLMKYLLTVFGSILTEHRVAEYSARVLATDGSVRNAKTLLEELKIVYNRTRQMKITQELTEIISSIDCIQ